jgi:hypothetical protein
LVGQVYTVVRLVSVKETPALIILVAINLPCS